MDCYIALGSNLGDRKAHLEAALGGLGLAGLTPSAVSSVWETEPIGTTFPRWFWNMVVLTRTDREPLVLLDTLMAIEIRNGRRRGQPNAPRTLDLDLLLLGDVVVDEERLRLPHPRMWGRRFVLEPLAEIAPAIRNPSTGRTVQQESKRVTNSGRVLKLGDLASCPSLPL
jgi:2-amino-4-hydroxy-6-hydroxymethyldihydropteridine diphosphokinase